MNKDKEARITAYDKIRDLIISRLEEAKKAAEDGSGEEFHWVRPWSGSGLPLNVSYATEDAYKGINQIILMMASHGADEWLTFSAIKKYQEKDSKVKLRKGAHGQSILYFDKYVKKDKEGNPIELDDDGNPIWQYFAKVYYVFSVEDVEGLPRHTDKVKRYEHGEDIDINRLESVLLHYYKAAGIELEVADGGNRAFYSRSDDVIRIPDKSNFEHVASYAHTMAHETIHSTGKALGREQSGGFGSSSYGMEELVADIGADFLTNRLHITSGDRGCDVLENSIAYIDGWLGALKSDDKKLNICKAAAEAQKAADYIYDTAMQKMKEEMQIANEAVMQFENGVCLYIVQVGDGLYQYSFYEGDGTYIDGGTVETDDDAKNTYDVARKAIEENELSIEDGWLLPVEPFKENIRLLETCRGLYEYE